MGGKAKWMAKAGDAGERGPATGKQLAERQRQRLASTLKANGPGRTVEANKGVKFSRVHGERAAGDPQKGKKPRSPLLEYKHYQSFWPAGAGQRIKQLHAEKQGKKKTNMCSSRGSAGARSKKERQREGT